MSPARRSSPVASLIAAPVPVATGTWEEFLQERIVQDWRPGQFDPGSLLFIPDVSDPTVVGTICSRPGCGVMLNHARLCPSCSTEFRRLRSEDPDLTFEAYASTPRIRRPRKRVMCLVGGCQRQAVSASMTLCASHKSSFNHYRKVHGDRSPVEWASMGGARPLASLDRCRVGCGKEVMSRGLCAEHADHYRRWRASTVTADTEATVDQWLARDIEPPMDPESLTTYGSVGATPFSLLPEPLRWEFLHAVQQRDLRGRAKLDVLRVRTTYLHLRRSGRSTAVGLTNLGFVTTNSNLNGALAEWQHVIDEAHRQWSGVDSRDPRIIYWSDIELKPTTKRIGRGATTDLRKIEQPWIYETITSWAKAAPRGFASLDLVGRAWTVADEVLRRRGSRRETLGADDMNAIVKAIRARWGSESLQSHAFKAIDRIIEYGHSAEDLHHYWGDIPARFRIDSARHRPVGTKPRSATNTDEPFRFVPQPIVDWVMDHIHLLEYDDPYSTAEARALIFIQERCGRRTSETLALKDDCISYDNQGAPYLEWVRGKPPYVPGKRLPIHQETHDVIRQWQQIKRDAGIESQWLFPSRAYVSSDQHYGTKHLRGRLQRLIDAINEKAPFQGSVEGADGNLIYFDLNTIDPYALRHAFAQRLADATDADGRPTTPPDVLQEYMGHKNFNTTMVYYEVTAKRRRKAMEAIPARRLNLHGDVISVDRERDGFTKIAVTLGHCSEPQNVAAGGHFCMLEHSCESCPFFLVDPLERDGMDAKRQHLKVKMERAAIIGAQQHVLDHYEARIKDCTRIIDGIDAYIDQLPADERDQTRTALDHMADIRRRATAPRAIDLRAMLTGGNPNARP